MHRTALAIGHSSLATCQTHTESDRASFGQMGRRTEKLANNTLDGSTSENGERMTPIRGNDAVILLDRTLHAHRNSLLSNCKMAESANELGLVQRVGSHFHAAHCCHLAVHLDEPIFRNIDLERRGVAAMRVERLLVQLQCERLRARGRESLEKLGSISRGLDRARQSRSLQMPLTKTFWVYIVLTRRRGARRDVTRRAAIVGEVWADSLGIFRGR
jgi:hypothetical protein